MPIPEVHACWPPKYGYGLLDLSVDHECRGGREYSNLYQITAGVRANQLFCQRYAKVLDVVGLKVSV